MTILPNTTTHRSPSGTPVRLLTSLALLFALTITATAQTVTTRTITCNGNVYEAFSVMLQPERGEVRDAFADWVEDNRDVKVEGAGLLGKDDVLHAEGVRLRGGSVVRLLAEATEVGERTRLDVFARAGGGTGDLVTAGSSEGRELRRLVDDFLADYVPSYYAERVEDTEENVEDLRKDLDDLRDKLAKRTGKRDELNEEIAELERDILETEEEYSAATQRLRTRATDLDRAVERTRN